MSTLEQKAIKAANKRKPDKHQIEALEHQKEQDRKNEEKQQRYRVRNMYSSPTDKFPKNRILVDHRPALDRSYTQRKFEDDIVFAAVDTEYGPIGFGGKTKKNKKSKTTKKSKKNRKSNKKRKSKKSKH
jgi:hypothetical protein